MRLITFFLLLLVFISPVGSTYGKDVPVFWIRNMEGERFDSRKQHQPFVLSFFFVNCIPCIKEIPQLYEYMSSNHPDIPLLFIDPIKEDSKKDIQRFSQKLGVPESHFYKDNFGSVSKKFFKGQFAFPTIIGVDGKEYLFRFSGIDDETLNKIQNFL